MPPLLEEATIEHPRATVRRILGPFHLALFLTVALVNLNSTPVVASIGPGALLLWLLGFLLFLLPESIAVLELSRRYPREGGIYNWTKAAFGDAHAFVCGWCYWTNNIFYVPTLLFYVIGFTAFIGGEKTAYLSQTPAAMASISLSLLVLITLVNIRGFEVGKWVQGIAVLATVMTTAVVVAVGILAFQRRGMANPLSVSALTTPLHDLRAFSLLSIVCLNYVGLELGSVLGDEIKRPSVSIPRAVVVAGVCTAGLYLLCTFALQAIVPAQKIGLIEGLLQGVSIAAADLKLLWLVPPIAILMSLNAAGNTSVWLAGSARIPFVIGLDRYLPSALGRTHARYLTPYVSLLVQCAASGLFILFTAVGSTVNEMYLILLQATTILQLIPYLYMFAALLKVRVTPHLAAAEQGFFKRGWVCVQGGTLGLTVTTAGLVLALLPSRSVSHVGVFEVKLLVCVAAFLIPARVVFQHHRRQIAAKSLAPQPLEVLAE
ncbi:MAG: APC family permease [candidate division KSB1 bacterium]|nr:APC family permease [candidate division KSB1 bacterium]